MNRLTVEIFRDATTPDASVDHALDGIEHFGQHTPHTAIEIVGSRRLIRTTDGPVIDTNRIRWPQMRADLNLIMTERALSESKVIPPRGAVDPFGSYERRTIGRSLREVTGYPGSSGVAIVNTLTALPSLTVAHESAHMMGLKQRGKAHDGDRHCTDSDCILYPEAPQGSEYSNNPSLRRDFCQECGPQLGMRAFYLLERKHGKSVPDSLF